MTPSTDLARRVAALCKRKPTTPWSPREISVYKRLVKSKFFDNLDDLALIEQYYAFERKKGEHGPNRGCHRRDLYTFLFNAASELDRATAWREAHPIVKPPRKIIPIELPSNEPPLVLNAEDQERADKFLAELHRRNPDKKAFQPRSAFQEIKAEMGR
jgi:hypothetical protein